MYFEINFTDACRLLLHGTCFWWGPSRILQARRGAGNRRDGIGRWCQFLDSRDPIHNAPQTPFVTHQIIQGHLIGNNDRKFPELRL